MSASETALPQEQNAADNRQGRAKSFLIAWARSRPVLFGAVMSLAMMATKMPMIPFVEMSGGAGTTEGLVIGGPA